MQTIDTAAGQVLTFAKLQRTFREHNLKPITENCLCIFQISKKIFSSHTSEINHTGTRDQINIFGYAPTGRAILAFRTLEKVRIVELQRAVINERAILDTSGSQGASNVQRTVIANSNLAFIALLTSGKREISDIKFTAVNINGTFLRYFQSRVNVRPRCNSQSTRSIRRTDLEAVLIIRTSN